MSTMSADGSMTWEELVKEIQTWPKERLKDSATVYLVGSDEFAPIIGSGRVVETDVLDKDHRYICIEN